MDYNENYTLGAYSGLVPNSYQEVFPGHFWRNFELEDSARLTLTQDFLCLPADEKTDILSIFNIFRNRRRKYPPDYAIGSYIEAGQEGKVFTLGEKYAIKIIMNYSYLDYVNYPQRMMRMSILRDYILPELPEWIDVVPNYLYLEDKNKMKYVVMPKVGSGITLYDLHKFCKGKRTRDPEMTAAIRRDFESFGEYELEALSGQYYEAEQLFQDVLNRDFPQFSPLRDFGASNTIVTKLEQPIDGRQFKLWIIDQ